MSKALDITGRSDEELIRAYSVEIIARDAAGGEDVLVEKFYPEGGTSFEKAATLPIGRGTLVVDGGAVVTADADGFEGTVRVVNGKFLAAEVTSDSKMSKYTVITDPSENATVILASAPLPETERTEPSPNFRCRTLSPGRKSLLTALSASCLALLGINPF